MAVDRKWLRGKLGRNFGETGNGAKATATDEASAAERRRMYGTGDLRTEVDTVNFDVEASDAWLRDCLLEWRCR